MNEQEIFTLKKRDENTKRKRGNSTPRRSPNIKLKLYKLQEGRCNAPCGEDG